MTIDLGLKLSQNAENIGDKEGENPAALCAVVFVLFSKNHRRGVRSTTYNIHVLLDLKMT